MIPKKKPKQKFPEFDKAKLFKKDGELKRGKLSRAEIQFVEDNVDFLSYEAIAKAINRAPNLVLALIKNHRLGRAFLDEKAKNSTRTGAEIIKALQEKRFYADLRYQLVGSELRYFEDHWIDMVSQFNGDLIPSEEMELKELLIIEILKNRENAAERDRILEREKLQAELRKEKALMAPNNTKIQQLQSELTAINASSSSHVRNFKDLCDRAEKIRKALHASRQDRVKHLENARIDFASWLRQLEDYGSKMRASREMEILKVAQEKERARLSQPHKFANGEVSLPIMNEDSIAALTRE